MSAEREPIRSYQRIFRPERRIYQVEGHALPVPGGVPLRWIAYTAAALLAVLALGSRSVSVALFAGLLAAGAGALLGGRGTALAAGAATTGGACLLGTVLGLLDWPLRLIVLPAAIGTLATQATPDGRRADRFLASWLALRLAPRRRSLGRALPTLGVAHALDAALWVAPDEHSPTLRRARLRGPGSFAFATPVGLRHAGLRRQALARPGRGEGVPAGARLSLSAGERLEVRP
jgi:hypothetical protein